MVIAYQNPAPFEKAIKPITSTKANILFVEGSCSEIARLDYTKKPTYPIGTRL